MLRSTSDTEVAKDRLLETWETTRDALAPRLTAARDAVSPYVDTAAARVAPVLDEAKVRLAPAVETARTKIRTDVMPVVVAAAETARDNSAPARAEAKERAAEAFRALRGERPARRRRWPLALACLVGGAALGAAAGMRRRAVEPELITPTPFPPPGQTAEAPTTTVAGASKPGPDQPAG